MKNPTYPMHVVHHALAEATLPHVSRDEWGSRAESLAQFYDLLLEKFPTAQVDVGDGNVMMLGLELNTLDISKLSAHQQHIFQEGINLLTNPLKDATDPSAKILELVHKNANTSKQDLARV